MTGPGGSARGRGADLGGPGSYGRTAPGVPAAASGSLHGRRPGACAADAGRLPAAFAALARLRPLPAAAGLGLGLAHVGEPRLGPGGPAEASAAASMAPRRRREFLAGRQAARRALRAVGADCGEIPRAGRLPVFPPGRAASISHSAGIAVAVARAPGQNAPLGCDLELRPLPAGATRLVLRADEERLVDTAAGPEDTPWPLTALFSAKEAAWKALYPAVGQATAPSMRTLRDLRARPEGEELWIGLRADPAYTVRVRALPVGAGVFSYVVGWADAAPAPADGMGDAAD
ncbi:4'-phosphopantetheinyl transferase superfamily protein [Streptomyces spinosus]|uniref:4'-phosphopantetheinyl transferase superfamily protein n=1 Tax=Streptomyces spinosus TaxID=2872623 RepID=UPI001CEDEE74|nr:4'-phosphopantetheinyl transferase superfamily protein [Streptomyces spinosus]